MGMGGEGEQEAVFHGGAQICFSTLINNAAAASVSQ